MGIPSTSVSQAPGAGDQANAVVAGTFTATGASSPFLVRGPFNVSVWGTFSATTLLQRSFDGGTTWLTRTDASGNGSYTAETSFVVTEPEAGVLYQLSSTWASGTVSYRLSTTGTYGTARTPT
jgi:hypothetical protein